MEEHSSNFKKDFPLQEFFVGIYRDIPHPKSVLSTPDFYFMEISKKNGPRIGIRISKGYDFFSIYRINTANQNLVEGERFQTLFTFEISDIKKLREKRRLKKISKKPK